MSTRRSQKGKSRGRRGRDNEVTTRDTPATMSIRGTAQRDFVSALPLLGHKFEIKKMLYYDSRFELTGAAGILQMHFFRANDLYDPDATGTGHQPIGFDQAMLFWEQFAVFSSKITVAFRSNNADGLRVGICLSPDQTVPPINELMENGYLVSDVVAGTNSVGLGYHTWKTLSMSSDNVKYFQMRSKEDYFANPNFIGNAAGSPAELNYFGVFAFNNITTTTTDVLFDVQLSYDARFQEPRKIAPSLLHVATKEILSKSKERDEKSATRDGVVRVSRADASNSWRRLDCNQPPDTATCEIAPVPVKSMPTAKFWR